MIDPDYHHSQTTRFTAAEAAETIGKHAKLTLEGTIIEVRSGPAGPCVVMEIDERFGFGPVKLGGDLELYEVEP